MDTTVAICTRDRREALLETLASIGAQQSRPGSGEWELLVVDNGSSDGTAEAVRGLAEATGDTRAAWSALRIVREPRRGLARARNMALAEARGELIVFVDDDLTCAPGWLAAHQAAHRATGGAAVVAAGGPIAVRLPPSAPAWWAELLPFEQGGPTARLELGGEPFTFAADDLRPLPFGGNLSLVRAAALAAGGFREDLGLGCGAELVTGEETDLLERLIGSGERVVWAPDARALHRVTADRLDPRSYVAWHRGHGRALVRTEPPRSPAGRALALADETWRIARYWVRARWPGPVAPRRAELWRKLGRAQGRWLELSGRRR